MNRWMDKDVVHIYNGAFLNHRKEWNNAICSNMDVPRVVILSEVNQRQISYITYMWNLKYDTNEPMYKIEHTHRHWKQAYGYRRAKERIH